MIINLTESILFTRDPDERFAKEYLLPLGTWRELWRRYKLLDYSNGDLRDYLFVKHARNLSYNSMQRWIFRSEIYTLASPMIKKGIQHANTSLFGNLEQAVLDELTKQLRYSGSKESRIII